MEILGIDGCRAGWVVALFSTNHCKGFKIVSNLEELITSNSFTSIWIDMPIGLPSKNDPRRPCDVIARKYLGKRASTIFSPPCREALYSNDYKTANQFNKEILGSGISKQSWNISPKIKSLDSLLRNSKYCQGIIHESHPEICFSILSGKVIMENKKTPEGFRLRLEILESYFKGISVQIQSAINDNKKSEVSKDDFVDAACLGVSAWLSQKNKPLYWPENIKMDEENLPMAMYLPPIATFPKS